MENYRSDDWKAEDHQWGERGAGSHSAPSAEPFGQQPDGDGAADDSKPQAKAAGKEGDEHHSGACEATPAASAAADLPLVVATKACEVAWMDADELELLKSAAARHAAAEFSYFWQKGLSNCKKYKDAQQKKHEDRAAPARSAKALVASKAKPANPTPKQAADDEEHWVPEWLPASSVGPEKGREIRQRRKRTDALLLGPAAMLETRIAEQIMGLALV
jgi:hypothetical protein